MELNNDCLDLESSNICKILKIQISAIPNYVSNFQEVPGSVKIGINFNGVEHHEFLDYIIENRPTSQCHIIGLSHVITFDEQKYQIFDR